ncbi:Sm-like ribonucleoprotein [Epithele typhae]|uniref:Sm-like ribonucleoprotein n=1 Tax=Epithele typhae TaxID=378194 RepID=UPI002007AB1C|nr:Sm-like ribonucleoprotein [Epithele typhae]KAH9927506.1 Sm-like ribonucleoprotein [Epithele typhae]
MSGRQQRVMVQPINVIFKNLQQRTKVVIWLYDNIEMRIEGTIIAIASSLHMILLAMVFHALSSFHDPFFLHPDFEIVANPNCFQGFDEFMNIVIDDAAEVFVKDAQPRRELGRILLKGDNITLIQQVV